MFIRPATLADAAGIARVHVDAWRETYASILSADYLAGLSYADRAARWQRILADPEPGTSTFVAEDDTGQIVGFAGGGPRRDGPDAFAGELYAIYLLRCAQGQGVGRRLVAAVAGALAQAGMRAMLLWVFAANPARGFYEALGGQLLAQQPFELGGTTLVEVAYGWPDVAPLLTAD